MPRVIHFAIGMDNPERAVQFYSKVFGWEIRPVGGVPEYWLISTGPDNQPGINGGLFKRQVPINYVHIIDVPSVDSFVARIGENGGKVVVPKMTIPGIGYLAYCQDTEQNVFGIMESTKPVT
jgi:predicted enzyme related to lactoylglutathione lyase